MPRIRRTRVQRLLRALQQTSRYSLRSAMIALAGCTGLPHIVAVSPDGRYVVAPMNDAGVAIGRSESKLVLIDLQTNKVTVLEGDFREPMWLRTANGVVVFRTDDGVIVLRHGQEQHIDDADFPALSPDGRYVAYTLNAVTDDAGRQSQPQRLMCLDLTTGQTTDLNVPGTLVDFSPDGKRISYVTQTAAGEATRMQIHMANIDGSDTTIVARTDEEDVAFFAPSWIDADHVLFQMKTPATGEDTELFLADSTGQLQPLTNDELDELAPQAVNADRIVYMKLPVGARDKDTITGPLWVAQRKDGKWDHQPLNVATVSMTPRNDDVVTIEPELEGDNVVRVRLMLRSLDDPQKATDLTQMVRDAGIALPAAQ